MKLCFPTLRRTFPAHEFFKEAGGVGQESLYRISKAYSVYDSEVLKIIFFVSARYW